MSEYEKTLADLIELLKLYSDAEMVQMINIAKLDYGAKQSSIFIPYKDLLSEMERRDIDCSHVRNYNSNLNEMVVELRDIDGKKWLFANWMMMFTDEDYSVISKKSEEKAGKEDENEDKFDVGIYCPICQETSKCEHIVAIYDTFYHSFKGGEVYDKIIEFEEIIQMGFRNLMKQGNRNPQFTLRSLKECWDNLQCRDPNPDEELIYIDRRLANKVILDVLRYHGADWGTIQTANSDPGFRSSVIFFFANDTIKVIKVSIGGLRNEFPGLGK